MDEMKRNAETDLMSESELFDGVEVDEALFEESADEEAGLHLHKKSPGDHHVSEIREFRGKNSKVYRMNDGSQRAVFFAKPVHTMNEETGLFESADHTFKEDEQGNYRNSNDRFSATFNKDKASEEIFSIESGEHSVTVCYVPTKKKAGKPLHKEKLSDKVVRFSTDEDGVDMDYFVIDDGVKENILVTQKAEAYRYAFELRCKDLYAEFDEAAKYIAFKDMDTEEEVFHIPAPFMTDAAGELSEDVTYELEELKNGNMMLVVKADATWINADERVLPVMIDPQIMVTNNGGIVTYGWHNATISKASPYYIGAFSVSNSYHTCRLYMKVNVPTLPNNPRIKKAELVLKAHTNIGEVAEANRKIGLYQVTGDITEGHYTPTESSQLVDFEKMRLPEGEEVEYVEYTFDITKLLDVARESGKSIINLVLKSMDESVDTNNYIRVLGDDAETALAPQICVTYESSYGVNTSYRAHTHALGRFGKGCVDLQTGNLMFESVDFNWSGRRKPVTIKHLYTSALSDYMYTANENIGLKTADFSDMKIGLGWKLNLMQSMVETTFQHDGVQYEGYVYIDENGEAFHFKEGTTYNCENAEACYLLYEDVETGSMFYDSYKRALFINEDRYEFDEEGHLVYITDSYGNQITITYMGSRIQQVTDGAGRVFAFAYNEDGTLASITAPDSSVITYTYTDSCLSRIEYPDGRRVVLNYSLSKPFAVYLLNSNNEPLYRMDYRFNDNRIASVSENVINGETEVEGVTKTYSYSAASHKTVVETTIPMDEDETEDTVTRTVYTFDNNGNVISEYVSSDLDGNAGVIGEDGLQCNSANYLCNHNFASMDHWHTVITDETLFVAEARSLEGSAKYGKTVLFMQSTDETVEENGAYQSCIVPSAGDYTFSAYVRVANDFYGEGQPGAFLKVTDAEGNLLGKSEAVTKSDVEYIRLTVTFSLSEAQEVKVYAVASGMGTAFVNAAQLERNACVNDYNMISYERCEGCFWNWRASEDADVSFSVDGGFNDTAMIKMNGDLDKEMYAYHPVIVKSYRSTRETFTLSGWAKATGVVNRNREGLPNARFCLHATVFYDDVGYNDCGYETHTAEFSPCTDEWQFVSIQFAKEKFRKVSHVSVYCDYSYNDGVAYFDDIRLVRDRLETGLDTSDFYEPDSKILSEYEEVDAPEGAPEFEELTDEYGNQLTETTFQDGEFGTIYRSYGYTENRNDLVSETDARGNVTSYVVDANTSRVQEVTDRCGNKMFYEYDEAGHIVKATHKTANDEEVANTVYTYNAVDALTEIVRSDQMKYVFGYNMLHRLESIGINGITNPLVQYAYKNSSGRLKQITYANGDTVKASYNKSGQMVSQKWYNVENNLVAHYKFSYDERGQIVKLMDITNGKEYVFSYEANKLVRTTEYDIAFDKSNNVVSREKVCTVSTHRNYGSKNRKKQIVYANEEGHDVFYEDCSNGVAVKFKIGNTMVVSHSKQDAFGRKEFEELQFGEGYVSRRFGYVVGELTEEHQVNNKQKSSPTSKLVSRISFSNGRTVDYEYDSEDRIIKVIDSEDGVTEYTYDALGRLLTETVNNETVKTMTYDNYGNILVKNGIAYTYGDTVWKDLLTGYGDKTISYDAQGNPISYLGHSLIWEKGRQLRSFDGIMYSYNYNGIRMSKTVDGITHKYVVDNAGKILCETWTENEEDHILVSLYDNDDKICGIEYNGTPYFFYKNLQGDIIAIVDQAGAVQAKYSYDAWGACAIKEDISQCSIAAINPYRYRSYYYDQETCLYYLQSRYYDPSIGRFINADDVVLFSTNANDIQYNLFAYCENDPINKIDYKGTSAEYVAYYNKTVFSKYVHKVWMKQYELTNSDFHSGAKNIDNIFSILGYVPAVGSIVSGVQNCTTSFIIFVLENASEEVEQFAYKFEKLLEKYSKKGNNDISFRLYLLWGEYNMHFKLQVFLKYRCGYFCAETILFATQYNGAFGALLDAMKAIGIRYINKLGVYASYF